MKVYDFTVIFGILFVYMIVSSIAQFIFFNYIIKLLKNKHKVSFTYNPVKVKRTEDPPILSHNHADLEAIKEIAKDTSSIDAIARTNNFMNYVDWYKHWDKCQKDDCFYCRKLAVFLVDMGIDVSDQKQK